MEFENFVDLEVDSIISTIGQSISKCLISIYIETKNIYFFSILDIDFINAKIHRWKKSIPQI